MGKSILIEGNFRNRLPIDGYHSAYIEVKSILIAAKECHHVVAANEEPTYTETSSYPHIMGKHIESKW